MIKEAVATEEDPEEETETNKETAREDLLLEDPDSEADVIHNSFSMIASSIKIKR